ncbi:MAG: calcium/calmodulin-dependent protein kinase, partial [Solirubrobacteraceae bacterium]|nr:calcium/calmodulin-dependent protein kinase [Solirubrobacteraceae bacterium]
MIPVKTVGRYELLDPIGHGGMAVVYLARQTDLDRQVALKELRILQSPDDPALAERFLREARMAGSMSHPNIVTVHEYFKHEGTPYIAMEYLQRGSLRPHVGRMTVAQIAGVLEGVLAALDHAEKCRIVHRDLKPENLLFRTPEDNADLLIADFGLSRIMDDEKFHVLTTTCGTPGYMAPEIFNKTGHGKAVDIWAMGVITYFLLCGYTPFDRDSDLAEMQAILRADFSFPPEYWRGVSEEAKDFIRKCLTVKPGARPTAHEALQHPFVAGIPGAAAGGDAAAGAREGQGQNLLPTVKKNFNARRTLHAAIDTVRAINKLREGGHANMNSPRSPAGPADVSRNAALNLPGSAAAARNN